MRFASSSASGFWLAACPRCHARQPPARRHGSALLVAAVPSSLRVRETRDQRQGSGRARRCRCVVSAALWSMEHSHSKFSLKWLVKQSDPPLKFLSLFSQSCRGGLARPSVQRAFPSLIEVLEVNDSVLVLELDYFVLCGEQ